jgi:hypothetical protein
MDIKRKTCGIRTWKKKHLFLDISSTNTDTIIVALPVRRNPQHGSLFDYCLSHFRTTVSTFFSSARRLPPRRDRFTRQTLSTVNRKHFFMTSLCIESCCPQKTHNETLLFGSVPQALSPFWLLKPASEHAHARLLPRPFLFWKNKCVYKKGLANAHPTRYLDCHEAGLCCYLVIQKTYYIHYSYFTYIYNPLLALHLIFIR